MILQKHYTRKDKSQCKFEVVIPKEAIEDAGFKEGDELAAKVKDGEIKLVKI
jgi:bifunctional DNA-binding transcriptional regulator/antitoxin component of YhaV-PrlF toxin-antitoxin module